MKPFPLFLHLVKFHACSAPSYLWLLVLGMSVMLGGIPWIFGSRNLETTLNLGDNLLAMAYFFILAAQLSWGIRNANTTVAAYSWATGSQEFLWTRAVDRGVLFWSKLAVFLAICSFVWISACAPKLLPSPPVRVLLFSNASDQAFKKSLLETSALAARVVESSTKKGSREIVELGRGGVVFAALGAWKVLSISLLVLWLIVVLRLRWPWLLAAFLGFIALSLAGTLGSALWKDGRWLDLIDYRTQILLYAQNTAWCWLGMAVFGAFVMVSARRRYLQPA